MDFPPFPSEQTIAQDLAAGLTHEQAIAHATQQLAEAINARIAYEIGVRWAAGEFATEAEARAEAARILRAVDESMQAFLVSTTGTVH